MGTSKACGGLGFRNIEAFNNAKLAKQLQRVLQNPNSLAAQILKNKYFKKTTGLEAKIGYRPSFLWRSLSAATDLLKEGVYWRLGNGKSIQMET